MPYGGPIAMKWNSVSNAAPALRKNTRAADAVTGTPSRILPLMSPAVDPAVTSTDGTSPKA
jgi:hypothetical protein